MRPIFFALVALLILGACSSSTEPSADDSNIRAQPDDTGAPYVVVAVDNHFHDIHPDNDIRIAGDRGFTVRNEGRNLHNFTVIGTDISIDIKAGASLEWPVLGKVLDLGTYDVFCRYHDYVDMTGRFTVTE